MAVRLRPPGRAPRKADKTGRSTGRIDKRARPKNQPRECEVEVWAWLPVEMMASPAWAALSPNSLRLVHRLMMEHAGQGGGQNGRLVATHDDLKRHGLTPASIRDAIEEAHALGVIRMTRQGGRWGGTNVASQFRLTWLGWWDGEGAARDPTNEWRGVTAELIEGFKAERKRDRAAVRKRRERKRANADGTPENSSIVPLNSAVWRGVSS